jgi:hypothetical protein
LVGLLQCESGLPTASSFPWAPPRSIEGWEPGQPVPRGYEVRHRTRRGAIIAGSVLFGVAYTSSAFAAWMIDKMLSNPDAYSGTSHHELYIPVVGPLWEFSHTGPTWSQEGKTTMVVDGLAQAAGLGLLAYGILARKPLLVRNDGAIVSLAPTAISTLISKDAPGLGLMRTF